MDGNMVSNTIDPVRLTIFRSLFSAVAEEMGATLMRSASSPNIKERRDYSCAVFTGEGELVAQGEHMPVHLGSMPLSVRSALNALEFQSGDRVILNDPFRGGTHLPDITLIAPVFVQGGEAPAFFVANRAHHADVGGMSAGSMPLATEIFQEGIVIPPVKWIETGQPNRALQEMFYRNVRTPVERREDLAAQTASLDLGANRLKELVERYSLEQIRRFMIQVCDYSERLMQGQIGGIPDGEYTAVDYLDDDGVGSGPVRIECRIRVAGNEVEVNFEGTDQQVEGSLNAVYAITYSATVYCFRAIADEEIPVNSGCFRPITVKAPEGTLVNAVEPAAVAGGNVETSQRTVDVVLNALSKAMPGEIPAASQGTMNNLAIGGTLENGEAFGYYETIAGGMGARPHKAGLSGIHTHMTNTMNTPVEALESVYPFRIKKYSFRDGSGGPGRHRGGNGLVRELQVLRNAGVTMLSDRRTIRPYGLEGGGEGSAGRNSLIQSGEIQQLPSKFQRRLSPGDILRIETPGGGGYGAE